MAAPGVTPWTCGYCHEAQDVEPDDLLPCHCCGGGSFTRLRTVEESPLVVTDTADLDPDTHSLNTRSVH